MSQYDALIERGDAKGILREWARSEKAAAEGRFCECVEPDLTGRKSHLCFTCGLYNLARKAEIEAAMLAPHPYEPLDRRGRRPLHSLLVDSCCDFCAMPRKDPRHAP